MQCFGRHLKEASVHLRVFVLALLAYCHGVALGEEMSYQPKIGQPYEYGIEVRIAKTSDGGEFRMLDTLRCRIVYEVTNCSAEQWEATYATVPFNAMRPWSESGFREHIRQTELRISTPAPNPLKDNPSMPPFVAERIMRSILMTKERSKMYLQRLAIYPGLSSFCTGTLSVTSRGEVVSVHGKGNTPLLLGHIAKLPLMRLPAADQTGDSFSYKDVVEFGVISDGTDPIKSQMSLLSVVKSRTASDEGLVAYDREFEQAGGASVGIDFTTSGTGFSEFSKTIGMPFKGNIDFKCDGLNYNDIEGSFRIRVGFHLLNGWRREFFDNGFLPTDDALAPINLPRMDDKTQLALQRQLLSKDLSIDRALMELATVSAPPNSLSLLQETLTKTVAKIANSSGENVTKNVTRNTKNAVNKDFDANAIAIKSIHARWALLRRLATQLPRSWSDPSGSFRVEALLVEFNGGNVSIRRIDNDQIVQVPISRLSDTDIEFAKSFGVRGE